MKRPRKNVLCVKRHHSLTVGRTYSILEVEEDGFWVYGDNGYIIYVKNQYFNMDGGTICN